MEKNSTVERVNTEVFDQAHQMYAEGSSDEKPLVTDIETLLQKEGYLIYDVDMGYDEFQGFWRWSCKIIKSPNPLNQTK